MESAARATQPRVHKANYRHTDPDGRRYRLGDLTNPNKDRPNLTYEFLGVTRVWRWTQERMQAVYDDGRIIQTAPGRVPAYKRYLDEQPGVPVDDLWADIPPLSAQAKERVGYPTQKPLALLDRIIQPVRTKATWCSTRSRAAPQPACPLNRCTGSGSASTYHQSRRSSSNLACKPSSSCSSSCTTGRTFPAGPTSGRSRATGRTSITLREAGRALRRVPSRVPVSQLHRGSHHPKGQGGSITSRICNCSVGLQQRERGP